MDNTAIATQPSTSSNTTAENISKNIQAKADGKPPEIQPAAKEGEQSKVVDPNQGKEKYLVNGKEIWLSPDEAKRYVQKGIAFEPQVTALHHLKNEIGEFMGKLKNDPAAILFDKRIGLTPEDALKNILKSNQITDSTKELIGQWYYENVVEPMKLSPEQLKAREDAKWRIEREAQDARARDEMVKEENRRRADEALNQIKANIAEAMKESGLPNNDTPLGVMMARRIADVMRLGYFQRQTITPKQAIEKVKLELKNLTSVWYDHLDDDQIVKEIGEKNAEKFKRYFLKLAKEAEKKPTVTRTPSTNKGDRKTMSPDEFHDYLDSLKKGGKTK